MAARVAATGVLAAAAGAALADGRGQPPSGVPLSEIGHATRAWLALQRSNAEAAPAIAMTGAEATLMYRRYLDSFRTKIPAAFGSPVTGNGSSGGGSSGAGSYGTSSSN
jgi:hypothetical protein